ncbi:MAG: GNAT family N-acetyltransferase [Tropicimonas sp.]|uniref:GNAT family N-acetyltransferase n=1 Tax=Tropicimonas sp. TaxID=2067044 RepID=UPI003A8A562C
MNHLPHRPLDLDDPAELQAHADLISRVFLMPRATDAAREERRQRMHGERVSVVEDGQTLVATFRSWDSQMSVPGGGSVPVNAVSGVVVSPTHRRRGLLRDWLTSDLHQAQSAGMVASVLWASEATIYGRYGFGPLTAQTTLTLDLARGGFAGPASGSLEAIGLDG